MSCVEWSRKIGLLSSCLGCGFVGGQSAIKMLGKDAGDAVPGVSVPERWDTAGLRLFGGNLVNLAPKFLKIVANEDVRT